jgi:beta-lactamase class D
MPRSFFTLLFIPLFFTACSPDNVTVDNSLQRFFDSAGVKGSFGFFDNMHGHFTIYNLSRYRDSAYSPAGTFDIVQSLVALQSGVARDERNPAVGSDSMRMDTVTPQWTAPVMSLTQALQATPDSANLGFADLARRIGRDTLKKWIDTLHYGNRDISGSPDSFWLQGGLKITADEQLGLLKKLYFNQLPFYARPQQLVCRMFPSEVTSNYKLTYMTGQGRKEDGSIGWVIGWVEENKHPYFFVVNLESPDPRKDLDAAGLSIAKNILQQLGFFQGKK